ncbi:hypothetical protein ABT160_41600 [Streptomyces sp. NPDC001941]|uniref:hypothetical protein n=1 Tax=Streptomyces sp. NPDC001941 TaxID=3154659 RepID=UPI00332B4B61
MPQTLTARAADGRPAAAPPYAEPSRPDRRTVRSRARHDGPRAALGVVAAVQGVSAAVHLTVLALMTAASGTTLGQRLVAWDGQLYLSIAADGYPDSFHHTPDGALTGNNLAFFPLYPLLVRALHAVTPLSTDLAGLVTAQLALSAALYALYVLLGSLYGRRTALCAVVLVAGVQPMALCFFMAYSEALFLALAAWTLLALRRGAWLSAGVLALCAGLTRPAAVAVVAAVACAAGQRLWRARRWEARPVAAVLLGCLGTPAYLLWVGLRLGRPDAWFVIQEAGWGTHWDSGAAFLRFLLDAFAHQDGWVPVSSAVLLCAVIVATGLAWRRGEWPPLLVYGTALVVLTVAQSNFYHSKLRLLIPAVVFLLPPARALARARPVTAGTVLAAGTLFGSWYGAHMLTVWPYAI